MEKNPTKELYNQLRILTCEELWRDEIPQFDRASAKERNARVALVRAVGVVFSESGTEEQKARVKPWLVSLLQDPEEKIRRYAMTALPKLGAGSVEEAALLDLLRTTPCDREKKFLGQALDKIGGKETLRTLESAGGLSSQTEQKVKASVARQEDRGGIRMDAVLTEFHGLRLHLRSRRGLEQIVREEVETCARNAGKFRVTEVQDGLVALTPTAPFSLGDIYALRCFGTVGLAPASKSGGAETIQATANVIASPLSQRILKTFTAGTARYRLDFIAKGHQRGAVRLLANAVYALCPEILNDARDAPWSIDLYPGEKGDFVELRPRLIPDPRFSYRMQDVPAASHPPLAACLARLAGPEDEEIVWDPFCGSGLELIERAKLGGVRTVYGTDLSEAAIAITQTNFSAAGLSSVPAKFHCADFRDFAEELGPRTVSLIITNPPLGRRVPIPSLRQLIADLFFAAATVLRPGGRLILINPLSKAQPPPTLRLQSRQMVDLGGFTCRMEKYRKVPA